MGKRVKEITITPSTKGVFSVFKPKGSKKGYDFSETAVLRQLLSNEKARILSTIRTKKPGSVYQLSKILKRSFKSVSEDIKLLERFGFIELIEEKTKNRKRHRPVVVLDSLIINLKI